MDTSLISFPTASWQFQSIIPLFKSSKFWFSHGWFLLLNPLITCESDKPVSRFSFKLLYKSRLRVVDLTPSSGRIKLADHSVGMAIQPGPYPHSSAVSWEVGLLPHLVHSTGSVLNRNEMPFPPCIGSVFQQDGWPSLKFFSPIKWRRKRKRLLCRCATYSK